jgi:hypothetical protein
MLKSRFYSLIKAVLLIMILTFYRLFFVYDFFKDYSRIIKPDSESFTNPLNIFLAMWGYPSIYTSSHGLTYSWGEITSYIGIGTLIALLLIIASCIFYRNHNSKFSIKLYIPLVLLIICFMLSLGYAGSLSPYSLAQNLPLFNAMRVATRWVFWISFLVLIIIASYKGKKFAKIVTLGCIIAAIELFIRYPIQISEAYKLETCNYKSEFFHQEKYNNIPRIDCVNGNTLNNVPSYDENLFESTKNNIGQVYVADSLFDTSKNNSNLFANTQRCRGTATDKPCPFVISNNAKVEYWSPNYIKVIRTSPGAIEIDMNPGNGWRINNQYPFYNLKSVSATDRFIFGTNDTENKYDILYAPRLSPSWLIWRLKNL